MEINRAVLDRGDPRACSLMSFLPACAGPDLGRKQHGAHGQGYRGANQLRRYEARHVIYGDAGERRGEPARKGDRRVGERGGGREPIGRGDRQSDQPGHRLGGITQAAENRHDALRRRI